MTPQSYQRHAYRPIATNIAGTFTLLALINLIGAWLFGFGSRDVGMVSLALAVGVLVGMSRTYIVRLQDRIILLEMKVRAAELLTPEQEARLAELSTKQIVALRFASDGELGDLLDRAAREKLTPDQIKREVKTWRPDYLRT